MNPHLMLAQAIAAGLAPVRTGAAAQSAPTLERAFEALQEANPDEDNVQAYRSAVMAAADALCGADEDRWMDCLIHVALWRPRDLVEVCDAPATAMSAADLLTAKRVAQAAHVDQAAREARDLIQAVQK